MDAWPPSWKNNGCLFISEYNLGLWRAFGLMRHTDPVLPAVLFSAVWDSFRNIKLTPQWDNYLSVNPSSAYCWLACIRASAAGLKWIRCLIVCWLLPDKKHNSWINFVIFKSLILSLMFSLYAKPQIRRSAETKSLWNDPSSCIGARTCARFSL